MRSTGLFLFYRKLIGRAYDKISFGFSLEITGGERFGVW